MSPFTLPAPDSENNTDTRDLNLGPTLGFLSLVWHLNHTLERASKRMESSIGITSQQRMIIRVLGRYPGITPGAVARALWIDAGTLSAALKRLESKGLVRRERDTIDRRRIMLDLTAKGKTFDVPHDASIEVAVHTTLGALSETDAQATRHLLEALTLQIDGIASKA